MRKLAEKVAVVAQICITFVFVLTTMLYMSNVIPQNDNFANNGVLSVLLFVLGIAYLLLSAYLVYVNFAARESINRLMLYCSSESATLTNTKVVMKIVKKCASQVGGISVKKVKIKTDENNGFVLGLKVNVTADSVYAAVDKLHCLLADCFKNVLGITFNSINFEIAKLSSGYVPSDTEAEKQSDTIAEYRETDAAHYNDPLPDYDEEKSAAEEKDADAE